MDYAHQLETSPGFLYVRRGAWALPLRRARKRAIGSYIYGRNSLIAVVRRLLDVGIATIVLTLSTPVWILVAVSAALGRRPLRRVECVGLRGHCFVRHDLLTNQLLGSRVVGQLPLRRLGHLWNVIKGDLCLVGPRPATVGEACLSDARVRNRATVRPGMICLWWLRRQGNVAYETEWSTDLEYVRQRSVRADLGILARSMPALLLGQRRAESRRGNLFGIPFDNVTMSEAISQIVDSIRRPGLTKISFLNADCINVSFNNEEYRAALQSADHVYADGVGAKLAGALLRCPVRENVNGTDLFPRLCECLSETDTRVFLLGGRPGVPEAVRDWVQANHPGVTICGVQHGYFGAHEETRVLQSIDESRAELVLVAFGAPKQDVWIRQRLTGTDVRTAIGVGGLFDFFSGRIPRAPQWMREIGMEWTYRLYQEPGRLWRRYIIGNVVFVIRAFIHRHVICESS